MGAFGVVRNNKINKVFGIGGIGTGVIFNLQDDRTMTRNESRPGLLTDHKNYCAAHIILHYIAALTKDMNMKVYAIGMVGQDDAGEILKQEMNDGGIDTRFVESTGEAGTMFSVRYQYPDGSCGSITASNSACEKVTLLYIKKFADMIDENSLVLAAPEVHVNSRTDLLEIGKEKGAFTVSSFLASEAVEFATAGGFALSDLICINADEAVAVGAGSMDKGIEIIRNANPKIKLIVTVGADGSYIFENDSVLHIPGVREEVISAAGAGDAYLGGTAAGLIRGMNFKKAAEYGSAVARIAVLSKDTIAKEVTLENLEYIDDIDIADRNFLTDKMFEKAALDDYIEKEKYSDWE